MSQLTQQQRNQLKKFLLLNTQNDSKPYISKASIIRQRQNTNQLKSQKIKINNIKNHNYSVSSSNLNDLNKKQQMITNFNQQNKRDNNQNVNNHKIQQQSKIIQEQSQHQQYNDQRFFDDQDSDISKNQSPTQLLNLNKYQLKIQPNKLKQTIHKQQFPLYPSKKIKNRTKVKREQFIPVQEPKNRNYHHLAQYRSIIRKDNSTNIKGQTFFDSYQDNQFDYNKAYENYQKYKRQYSDEDISQIDQNDYEKLVQKSNKQNRSRLSWRQQFLCSKLQEQFNQMRKQDQQQRMREQVRRKIQEQQDEYENEQYLIENDKNQNNHLNSDKYDSPNKIIQQKSEKQNQSSNQQLLDSRIQKIIKQNKYDKHNNKLTQNNKNDDSRQIIEEKSINELKKQQQTNRKVPQNIQEYLKGLILHNQQYIVSQQTKFQQQLPSYQTLLHLLNCIQRQNPKLDIYLVVNKIYQYLIKEHKNQIQDDENAPKQYITILNHNNINNVDVLDQQDNLSDYSVQNNQKDIIDQFDSNQLYIHEEQSNKNYFNQNKIKKEFNKNIKNKLQQIKKQTINQNKISKLKNKLNLVRTNNKNKQKSKKIQQNHKSKNSKQTQSLSKQQQQQKIQPQDQSNYSSQQIKPKIQKHQKYSTNTITPQDLINRKQYSTYYFNSQAQQDPYLQKLKLKRFKQYRQLILYFINRGYGMQHLPSKILQSYKSPKLTPRLYYQILTDAMIDGFKSIQDILLFKYRVNVTPYNKTQIRQIMKAVTRCNQWMALQDIQLFKKIYRYLYEIHAPQIIAKFQVLNPLSRQQPKIIQQPTEIQFKQCYKKLTQIIKGTCYPISAKYGHIIKRRPEHQLIQWTPQMDDIIIQSNQQSGKVSLAKPLLTQIYGDPQKAQLITTQMIKYRYCKLIRLSVKKLIFLFIKLRQVSKILADVQPLIIDDKRIKYIIWGLDAAQSRKLLLKIYKNEQVNQQIIKLAVKSINGALRSWIQRRRRQTQQGQQFDEDIAEQFYEKKQRKKKVLKQGQRRKAEQRPYNSSVTTFRLQAKKKLIKHLVYDLDNNTIGVQPGSNLTKNSSKKKNK